ncbi:ankyrin repeat domain-containing protein [Candidatus Dependentiae bacterium]|nr:MAG: ankyrin repeat domain-containing protein [Candidatus Dependentiae bacterium]
MQKKSVLFLWLISAGTLVGMEAVPDSPAPTHHLDKGRLSVSPPTFLERAHTAGAGLGRNASTLLQETQGRTHTVRRKSISPKKGERDTDHASPKTKKPRREKRPTLERSLSEFSHNLASIIPTGWPKEFENPSLDAFAAQQKPTGHLPEISPYQRLEYLDRASSPSQPSRHYADIPNEIQNARNEKLRKALAHKDIKQAIRLVLKGANPNEQDEANGNTLLHFAAGRDHLRTAKWLIEEKGARTDIQNRYRRTPLELAIILKNPRIAQLLVKKEIQAMVAQQRHSPPPNNTPSKQLRTAPNSDDNDEVIYAPLGNFKVF